MIQKDNTCCFFGHREIDETEELKKRIYETVKGLIEQKKVERFLFGSKSRFDALCLEIVSEIKQEYPHIRRVYVRAEYPDIDDAYKAYLLERYDETYYPEGLRGAGKAVYVERNREMIRESCFCVVYCDKTHAPTSRKSGTIIALDYAKKCQKEILNLAE